MKNVNASIKSTLLIITLSLTSLLFAEPYNFIAGDNSKETRLCLNAVTNDTIQFRSTARKMFTGSAYLNKGEFKKIKEIVNNVNCNDQNILAFADDFGAEETVNYMSKFLTPRFKIEKGFVEIKVTQTNKEKKKWTDDMVVVGSL